MLIEIGELLYDALSGSAILFACVYVVGKVIDLINDVIRLFIREVTRL